MKIIAHIDGSSMGNPGEAGYGIVLHTPEGELLETYGDYIGRATNNVAEYQGLIACLRRAEKYDFSHMKIFSDSQLMVRQLEGLYKVKQPHLKELFSTVKDNIASLDGIVTIEHVKREFNKEADAVARRAVKLKGEIME